ncbi:hypothetical protein NC653_027308 [Populus alba x Populus x berolinensis]|uniref:Uncharacterized protein n=1 Tax=Populus alba x Populus x berolinensis TaxID=444605 RepID=A0AAD6M511_9ROSI|nr:hypothetical protein NC653_027308 [Populus alba x Populus x berolinensis]
MKAVLSKTPPLTLSVSQLNQYQVATLLASSNPGTSLSQSCTLLSILRKQHLLVEFIGGIYSSFIIAKYHKLQYFVCDE